MPITYCQLLREFYRTCADDYLAQSVLLVECQPEMDAQPIGDLFRRLDPALRQADLFLFRSSSKARRQLATRLQNDSFLSRHLHGRQVAILASQVLPSRAREVSLLAIQGYERPINQPSTHILRSAETESILRMHHAIYSDPMYHFALPSGLHAEKFVRFGDALVDPIELDRLRDWLVPNVDAPTLLVADTGSLLPLLLALQHRVWIEGSVKTEVICFQAYPTSATVKVFFDTLQDSPLYRGLQSHSGSAPALLCIVSVSSGGSLCDSFRSHAPSETRIVVLCDTSVVPTKSDVSFLYFPVKKWPVLPDGACLHCRTSPTIIPIDPISYERIPRIQIEAKRVTRSDASQGQSFWEIAERSHAVELHVDVTHATGDMSDFRHFSVFLHIDRLLADSEFHRNCCDQLALLPKPNLVLIPMHRNTDAVAALVKDVWPDIKVLSFPPARFEDHDLVNAIAGSDRILVADDALVSGMTLYNVRPEIYRVAQAAEVSPEVYPFVVVSRPPDPGVTRTLALRYVNPTLVQLGSVPPQRKSIPCGVEVFLPLGKDCPWCIERRLFEDLQAIVSPEESETHQRIVSRIRDLEGTLRAEKLFIGGGHLTDDVKTYRSYFGTLSPCIAFAAAVAACQKIRGQLSRERVAIEVRAVGLDIVC